MKPLFITLSGGPGNPAELTLSEALKALNSGRFAYLRGVDRERLAEDITELARALVTAAMLYRDEHPELEVRRETIDALLELGRP